ncbi:MAG TPA: aminotransferase class V-fold PLP-dependent enzyme, partial [Acidimicrobiales bacterium]
MRRSLEEVRRDTPGVESVIHFNNAGAALPPQVVVDTVVDHLRREALVGGYEAAAEAAEREEAVYASIAALIGAESRQVATIENATRAWDMAVYGYPFQPGDRVLTARAEYASNVIALLQLCDRFAIEIVLIEDDEHGQISLDHLEAELSAGAAMVALTHVP